MTKYHNFSGTSGVYAYEIEDDSIKVQFKDGAIYLYNNAYTGSGNITQMKSLAIKGSGLNSFINTYVRKNYAAKLR